MKLFLARVLLNIGYPHEVLHRQEQGRPFLPDTGVGN